MKPVAWMQIHYKDGRPTKFSKVQTWEDDVPLYTHPEKTEDEGKVCARCGAIAYDPVITQTAKTLTDEEIAQAWAETKGDILHRLMPFARAILRKVQENG